jgi:hypothetical protein
MTLFEVSREAAREAVQMYFEPLTSLFRRHKHYRREQRVLVGIPESVSTRPSPTSASQSDRVRKDALVVENDPGAAAELVDLIASNGIDDFSGERQKVAAVLADFMEHLDDADTLLLRYLFVEDRPISVIASMLEKNQRILYRRRDELLKQMRRALGNAGLTGAETSELDETMAKTAAFGLAKKQRR